MSRTAGAADAAGARHRAARPAVKPAAGQQCAGGVTGVTLGIGLHPRCNGGCAAPPLHRRGFEHRARQPSRGRCPLSRGDLCQKFFRGHREQLHRCEVSVGRSVAGMPTGMERHTIKCFVCGFAMVRVFACENAGSGCAEPLAPRVALAGSAGARPSFDCFESRNNLVGWTDGGPIEQCRVPPRLIIVIFPSRNGAKMIRSGGNAYCVALDCT
jgi:hypothetical protein